jgi:hypothetical protein
VREILDAHRSDAALCKLVGHIVAGSLLLRSICDRRPGRAQWALDLGLATLERPRHSHTGRPYGGRRVVTPTDEGWRCIDLARAISAALSGYQADQGADLPDGLADVPTWVDRVMDWKLGQLIEVKDSLAVGSSFIDWCNSGALGFTHRRALEYMAVSREFGETHYNAFLGKAGPGHQAVARLAMLKDKELQAVMVEHVEQRIESGEKVSQARKELEALQLQAAEAKAARVQAEREKERLDDELLRLNRDVARRWRALRYTPAGYRSPAPWCDCLLPAWREAA